MDKQGLRTLLEQLQNELEHTESMDDKGQELLRNIDKEIHVLLTRSEQDHVQASSSTVSSLQDAVDYFEVTHPTLTATLVKLLTVLGNAGI